MLELLEKLIWRHNILTEETEGLHSCVIAMHNLVHLPEDTRRFSSSDNFWCFVFERAVHNYIERSSNHKNLELTFAKAESRRELLKAIFKSNASTDIGDHDPESFLRASSIEQAKQFSSSYTRDPILIGGKKSVIMASSSIPGLEFQKSDIIATTCRSILFPNCQQGKCYKQYRTGEDVLMATSIEDSSVATVLRISDIFIVKHSGKEHFIHQG